MGIYHLINKVTATITSGFIAITSLPVDTYSAKALTVNASGDNTIHTPTVGTAIRLHYIALGADGGNVLDTNVIVKFGAAGASIYKVPLTPKALFARNIGAGRRYLQGAVDEVLYVNLSTGNNIHVSIEYEEI